MMAGRIKPCCETTKNILRKKKMIMWSVGARLLRHTSSMKIMTMSRTNPIRTGLIGLKNFTLEPGNIEKEEIANLMSSVDVEKMKKRLFGTTDDKETIPYNTLLETAQSIGIATSLEEAHAFARLLDDAEIVLLFRDKVYLHPDKVVEKIRKAANIALNLEGNPMKEEFKRLKAKKEEIDALAHRQVRRILWCGLASFSSQIGLFFRLTFWDFSWKVTAPITFFWLASQMITCYAFFLLTSRDPTYEGLMKSLFFSRQRKLRKIYSFDIQRFKELERKC